MLSAPHRLRRSGEFTQAMRQGRRAGRGTLVVHLWVGSQQASPRAGFAVSRAVGNAVVRNRVRRRLRHLVREQLTVLPAGAQLVVRALPPAATASYARLGEDFAAALHAVRRTGART